MKLPQFVPFFAIIAFSILLIFLYQIENPGNRPASITSYPYVLGAKPAYVATGETTSISVVRLDGKLATNSDSPLFVVTPDGRKMELLPMINDLSKITFPDDFLPSGALERGPHTIVLVPQNNGTKSVVLTFYVVAVPFFTEAYNFVFGPGLVPVFGLTASIAATLYQIASARKSSYERRQDDKAKWITENMKSYIVVSDMDAIICSNIEPAIKQNNRSVTSNEAFSIMYAIVLFHREFIKFIEKPGVFYFDDYRLENFLGTLGALLFESIRKAIGDNEDELAAFKDRLPSQLSNDAQFNWYKYNLQVWLNNPTNRNLLYRNHFVHSKVMGFAVNKAVIMTYSDQNKLKRDLNDGFAIFRKELEAGISAICDSEFPLEPGESGQYFKIYRKDVFQKLFRREGVLDM